MFAKAFQAAVSSVMWGRKRCSHPFRPGASQRLMFSAKQKTWKLWLSAALALTLVSLPALACGQSGSTSTPTPSPQGNTGGAPGNAVSSPTQDPNAPDFRVGSSPLLDTRCATGDCAVDFFLARHGTTIQDQDWPQPVPWTARTSVPSVTLDKYSGTLTQPSDADTVVVTSIPHPCQFTWIIFSTPELPTAETQWPLRCDPGFVINMAGRQNDANSIDSTASLGALSASAPGCSVDTTTTKLTCLAKLSRTSSYQGNVQWNIDTPPGGVSVQPSSDIIEPNQSQGITISFPCNSQGGSIRFQWYEDQGDNTYLNGNQIYWDSVTC